MVLSTRLVGNASVFFFPEPAVLSPCAARESLKCPVCKMLTNHRSSPFRSVLGMRGAWLSPRVLRGGLAVALAEPRAASRTAPCARPPRQLTLALTGLLFTRLEETFEMEKQVKMWLIYA